MVEQQQRLAVTMERMTDSIILEIDRIGGTGYSAENIAVIMGSLGAAIGIIARATEQPDMCLERAMEVARGIIDGSLVV